MCLHADSLQVIRNIQFSILQGTVNGPSVFHTNKIIIKKKLPEGVEIMEVFYVFVITER